jgi:hypothetical protein
LQGFCFFLGLALLGDETLNGVLIFSSFNSYDVPFNIFLSNILSSGSFLIDDFKISIVTKSELFIKEDVISKISLQIYLIMHLIIFVYFIFGYVF